MRKQNGAPEGRRTACWSRSVAPPGLRLISPHATRGCARLRLAPPLATFGRPCGTAAPERVGGDSPPVGLEGDHHRIVVNVLRGHAHYSWPELHPGGNGLPSPSKTKPSKICNQPR